MVPSVKGMTSPNLRPDSAILKAMICAGLVTAQFVAGKAARDALFLSNLDVTTLPAMVFVTAGFSILLVVLNAKWLRNVSPVTFVPLLFTGSAVLLLLEWALVAAAPVVAGVVVYLHVSGAGPMLGSSFWLVATERFDPRTAKRRFGQITAAGTMGGLMGGLIAERVAALSGVGTMLPVLAALNLACAWQIRQLAEPLERLRRPIELSPELAAEPPRSGLQVMKRAPYLRSLAALVLLGTAAAALADYVFKAQAVTTLGRGDGLLGFFAMYYAGISLITFVLQSSTSRVALEKLGLGLTTGAPSVVLAVGSIGALIGPGLPSIVTARGGESVFRGSLFRAGYELFYTPIPVSEKRAAKSIIDVGFDRLGDAAGAVLVTLALIATPAYQLPTMLGLAFLLSGSALIVAMRLNRGYIQTLERSLLNRAVELDLSDTEDLTTRSTMTRTLSTLRALRRSPASVPQEPTPSDAPTTVAARKTRASESIAGMDTVLLQIAALRSRDRERILRVLRSEEDLPAALVPHVIPLLAWDPVANEAVRALRRVAAERVGELIDTLIDQNQDFAVRRRLARVFSVCVSQRAANGLLLGLEDVRFEVRFHCARSLAAILARNPRITIDRHFIFEIVRRETAVGRPVWESQRLLHQLDETQDNVFVDEFVKNRASRSLAHVFTLLALVLPTEPLQIAFRGLHTSDPILRGTALEYLEGVLPATIRDSLWPYLEDSRPKSQQNRPREEILEDLLRSNESIMLNLRALQQRGSKPPRSA